MAQPSRSPASPPSSSPARLPSISRPDWPWATPRSYSHSSQQGSGSPRPSLQGSNLQNGWDPRPSTSSSSTPSAQSSSTPSRYSSTPKPMSSSTPFRSTETTRQWTFIGFEWAVNDVQKLRNFVEDVEPVVLDNGERPARSDLSDFEILRQSPMIGDHKFKLEIAQTLAVEGEAPSSAPPTLSLYITSLMLELVQGDYETHASMMAAIKIEDDRVGQRGARPDWVWEFWQNDWVFRRESEVWGKKNFLHILSERSNIYALFLSTECPLPSLSSLLEHPRIQEADSFVLCVQIHSPVGPSIPQQPSVYYVPRDLLDGIESSLDNPNTGDVRFVCLEKRATGENSPTFSSYSAISDSTSAIVPHTIARKRVIYAHSDLLIRRSEYFATMLTSAFAENPGTASGERKLYTIVVEEATFETVYWLLKYCYANWLLFKRNDDPRAAVEGLGAGWSANWLSGGAGEWDWKPLYNAQTTFEDNSGDTRSATSAESSGVTVTRSASAESNASHPNVPIASSSARISPVRSPTTSASIATTSRPVPLVTTAARPATTSRAPATSSSASTSVLASGTPPGIQRSKPISVPTSSSLASQHPSARSNRHSASRTPDPHSHPTLQPEPASALAVYQIAHRYAMSSLADLALEHIMSTITPQSSFALLLATFAWEDLRILIENFVVERWDEVSTSAEFEQCCSEVASGEWGLDGGKTLMSVFRRLRSPA
ncbi:hypothetical protein D9619_000469 [Psilocybe cf. subviscida]|uniref:BTB domain-containing protein n=1 Tax=Psilocybe cf. subviscida TaxID=2480587 RepID=A0A8H5BE19_9AGAR|nr:hypothetical protein D9619_000469 [Psilocybe cf. subviscida]